MTEKVLRLEGDLYYLDGRSGVETPAQLLAARPKRIPCRVPGNVELDLEAAGVVPELFGDDRIRALEAFELNDYWYRLRFDADPDFDELAFEGVDTVAEYFLNGERLGRSENMFVPHVFSVRGKLRTENELYVRIASAVLWAQTKEYGTGSWGLSFNAESVHLRKAPHEYGWDICPRALLGGIFKRVVLRRRAAAEIEDVYLHTLAVDYRGAHLRGSYDLDLAPDYYHRAELRIEGDCGGKKFAARDRIVFKHGLFGVTVAPDELALWNPKGYGAQNLYSVTARIVVAGETVAEHKFRFGIRVASLDYDPSGATQKFAVRVNGMPIMVKGTNWVPLDAFHSRDDGRRGRALGLLSESNCNAVRCWGGNLYEEEEFFDFCDAEGILVWQDFAMACNLYPDDAEFAAALEREAGALLPRLRRHPSLICYCGDNECDLGLYFNGIDPARYRLNRDTLDRIVFRYDPFRPYLPSSPFFTPRAVAARDEGLLAENHLWGPRDSYKGRFYTENKASFVSEIGYHGCPSPQSVRRFIGAQNLWPWENDAWMAHQTSPGGVWCSEWNRIKLMNEQVRELFGGVPDNLEDFAAASQISQAEALKFFVERTRMSKWEKTGILWWSLLDCWPQFSDAVVDYYFEKKRAFAYLRRSQAPLQIMLSEPENWSLTAVVGNDSDQTRAGSYRVVELGVGVRAEGEFVSPANENVKVAEIRVSRGVPAFFLLELRVDGIRVVNHYTHTAGPLRLDAYLAFERRFAEFIGEAEEAQP